MYSTYAYWQSLAHAREENKVKVTLRGELLVCLFDLFDTVTACAIAQARQSDIGIPINAGREFRVTITLAVQKVAI